MASGIIAFASCNSSGNSQNTSQADSVKVDSLANIKASQMQAQNDSAINALAKTKADSEILVHKEKMRNEHEGRRDRDQSEQGYNNQGNNNQGYNGQGNNQGYNNQPQPGSVNDRPGATNVNNGNGNNVANPKSVNDRPGATNTR